MIAASALLLAACGGLPSSLKPQSDAAAQITSLWWVVFGLGRIIWIGVIVLLLVGLFRRGGSSGTYAPLSDHQHARTVNMWVVGGGIVMPTLVLIGMVALTVGTLRAIPAVKPSAGVTIEVIVHQWWWEVVYPDRGITLKDDPAGQLLVWL